MNHMVKLQDKVKFVDDMGKSFIGTVVRVNHPTKTVDIKVKRKIGNEPQIFLRVPIANKKKTNKPFYTESSSVKKEIFTNPSSSKSVHITINKETPKKKE